MSLIDRDFIKSLRPLALRDLELQDDGHHRIVFDQNGDLLSTNQYGSYERRRKDECQTETPNGGPSRATAFAVLRYLADMHVQRDWDPTDPRDREIMTAACQAATRDVLA